jgi:hypothetical protein
MKMIWQILLTPLAALMLSSVHAECAIPEVVTVPDGETAAEDEMIAGQKRVKQYMANMQAYLDCIDAESAAIGEEQTDEQRAMYNAGVDAMESLAAQFNAEVKAYKASNN